MFSMLTGDRISGLSSPRVSILTISWSTPVGATSTRSGLLFFLPIETLTPLTGVRTYPYGQIVGSKRERKEMEILNSFFLQILRNINQLGKKIIHNVY